MNLEEIHPDELIFRNYIKDIQKVLIKCENQNLDDRTKENLKNIRFKVFEMQGARGSSYINKKGEFEEIPDDEKNILRQLGEIIEKICKILNEDIMGFYNSIGGLTKK